jgi:hypothetical protein
MHMADPPASPDTGDDAGVGPDRGSTAGTPRWVKVFGIVALAVVVLFLVLLLAGGHRGPGRHMGTPPAAIPEHGEQQA